MGAASVPPLTNRSRSVASLNAGGVAANEMSLQSDGQVEAACFVAHDEADENVVTGLSEAVETRSETAERIELGLRAC